MDPCNAMAVQLSFEVMDLALPLHDESRHAKKRRRIQGGICTTDVTLSAYVGDNAEVFPKVLGLHVPKGATVADVTFGLGVFWRNVSTRDYELLATDLKTGVDCRSLPYGNCSLDCVVLDPPYMEGLYRRNDGHLAGSGSHSAFRTAYSNGEETTTGPKWHDAVLDMYFKAGAEAERRAVREVPRRGFGQHPKAHAR